MIHSEELSESEEAAEVLVNLVSINTNDAKKYPPRITPTSSTIPRHTH